MKKYTLTIIYSLLLTGFTVYMLLDTFVIPRAVAVAEPQTTVESDTETTDSSESSEPGTVSSGTEPPDSEPVTAASETSDSEPVTETSETAESEPASEETQITISTYREYDTTIYVADIVLGSSDTIKTALAKGMYGKNIKDETSEIAEGVDAILAINGDFYGSRETGYCIRNGVLYRATANRDAEDLVIYSDGSFEIINESEITAEELLEKGAWQVLSFGPALVENGTVSVSESDEVGKAMASNPRTAICYMGENHYLFIVSDGRTDESEGLSLYQLACFAASLGAETVYNLDGGGSSTMYYDGEVINTPVSGRRSSGERSVSDIVYISY
ncbi:MAG: phosphodiester glycosidase family protein [Lachnospiraceae bacterium]|nr:phosphodiester glycosidase family protein [Lachnospiraceae bacterium]